jgi:hypothetical protein
MESELGGDVHDCTFSPGEGRQCRLYREQRCSEHDIEMKVPQRVVGRLDRILDIDCRIVDQHVEAAKGVERLRHRVLRATDRGKVRRCWLEPLSAAEAENGVGDHRRRPIVDGDPGASLAQGLHDRQAQPPAPAGDQSHSPGKIELHRFTLGSG